MYIHKIQARDLPDLWFQAIYDILEHGRRFFVDRGSYAGQTRLEYDYFIGHVMQPWHGSGTKEILPDIPASIGIPNPVELDYIYGGGKYERSYIEYLMTGTKMQNESYTYGENMSFTCGRCKNKDPNCPICSYNVQNGIKVWFELVAKYIKENYKKEGRK